MQSTAKLQNALLRDVSRSFYLSFRILPKAIRPVLSLGYLLCRAADTIADAPSLPFQEKKETLKKFKNLFDTFPISTEKLQEFLKELDYTNISPKIGEQKLLSNFGVCADWFNSFSRTDQSLLQSVVASVITGMEMDLELFEDNPEIVRALKTEKELESYIHWIGGEPGRFWSRVSLAHLPRLRVINPDRFIQDGIIFGTGLQMVNILRDIRNDLKLGRCYIPQELLERHQLTLDDVIQGSKEDVFKTIFNDLIDQTIFRLGRGLSYMSQLPTFTTGLRAAVWWPMMIGVKTLKRLREEKMNPSSTQPMKVSRSEVHRLMIRTFWMLPFDRLLKRKFEEEV